MNDLHSLEADLRWFRDLLAWRRQLMQSVKKRITRMTQEVDDAVALFLEEEGVSARVEERLVKFFTLLDLVAGDKEKVLELSARMRALIAREEASLIENPLPEEPEPEPEPEPGGPGVTALRETTAQRNTRLERERTESPAQRRDRLAAGAAAPRPANETTAQRNARLEREQRERLERERLHRG